MEFRLSEGACVTPCVRSERPSRTPALGGVPVAFSELAVSQESQPRHCNFVYAALKENSNLSVSF